MTRTADDAFEREELRAVQFVPLIGEQGWADADARTSRGVGPPRLGGPLRTRQPRTRPGLVACLDGVTLRGFSGSGQAESQASY